MVEEAAVNDFISARSRALYMLSAGYARAFVLEDAHFERIDHSFFVVRNHFAMFKMEGTEDRE